MSPAAPRPIDRSTDRAACGRIQAPTRHCQSHLRRSRPDQPARPFPAQHRTAPHDHSRLSNIDGPRTLAQCHVCLFVCLSVCLLICLKPGGPASALSTRTWYGRSRSGRPAKPIPFVLCRGETVYCAVHLSRVLRCLRPNRLWGRGCVRSTFRGQLRLRVRVARARTCVCGSCVCVHVWDCDCVARWIVAVYSGL